MTRHDKPSEHNRHGRYAPSSPRPLDRVMLSPRVANGAYLAAHVGKSLLWTSSDLVTIYALVSLYGVAPDLAGWLFLIGLAANALADVLVGAWLDLNPASARRLAGAGLLVAALVFPATILAAPQGATALAAAALAFRLAYAAYDVPHNATMARLAATADASIHLSRGRTVGTGVASAIVGLALSFGGEAQTLAVILWLLAGSALILGTALLPLLDAVPIGPDLLEAARVREASPRDGRGLPMAFLAGTLIGIVALGALGKATLQLPATLSHPPTGTILVLLTSGRTLAALLPLRFSDPKRGLMLLAAVYLTGVPVLAVLCSVGSWPMIVGLGLLLGLTNLLGWAILPLLARGARSFGLYTMSGKLALGTAGLVMTTALRQKTVFSAGAFAWFVMGALIMCAAAALFLRVAGRRIGRSSFA